MSAISPERSANPSASFEPLEGRTLFSVALDYAGSVAAARVAQKAAPSALRATPAASTVNNHHRGLNFWPPVLLNAYTGPVAGGMSIAAIDVNADTRPDIIVNTADGYTTALINEPNADFGTSGRFDNGTDPTHAHTLYTNSSVIFGPFTGSGVFDLAVASFDPYQNTSRISVIPSNDNGTFGIPVTSVGPAGPVTLIGAGDANANGSIDLFGAFGSQGGALLNSGNGTFASTIAAGASLDSNKFFLADLNGDGVPDVIESSGGTTNNNGPTVRLGISGGTYQAAKDLALPGGGLTYSFKVGDFNGDNSPDIIATSTGSPTATGKVTNQVYSLKGNGDGTFAAPVRLARATNPVPTSPTPFFTISTGDFNADGRLDFAVVNANYSGKHIRSFTLKTFLGTGKGTFYSGASRTLAGNDSSIPKLSIADIDQDGKTDIIVGGLKAGQIQVFFSF